MDVYEAIVTGVISGIATSIVVFISIQIFRTIVLPWYQGIVYRGVDVSGTWRHSAVTDKHSDEYFFEVQQHGHILKGRYTLNQKRQGEPDDNAVLVFDGTVWDGYITGVLRSENPKRLSLATILLKVTMGGRQMKGLLICRDGRDDTISPKQLVFENQD